MLLQMKLAGLSMTARTGFGDKTETAHSLTFDLQLTGRDTLTLETGEVFQNPAYASARRKGKTLQEISAQMRVYPASVDASHRNEMRYFAGVTGDDYGSPSFIYFEVPIPANGYSLLLNNIRGGVLPASVTVGLQHDLYDKASPLKYDHAPDGSAKIWHNVADNNTFINIESVAFYYQLLGEPYNDDDFTKRPTVQASNDAASVAIVSKLGDLEKAFVRGNGFIVAAIIIACAVLYFVRH